MGQRLHRGSRLREARGRRGFGRSSRGARRRRDGTARRRCRRGDGRRRRRGPARRPGSGRARWDAPAGSGWCASSRGPRSLAPSSAGCRRRRAERSCLVRLEENRGYPDDDADRISGRRAALPRLRRSRCRRCGVVRSVLPLARRARTGAGGGRRGRDERPARSDPQAARAGLRPRGQRPRGERRSATHPDVAVPDLRQREPARARRMRRVRHDVRVAHAPRRGACRSRSEGRALGIAAVSGPRSSQDRTWARRSGAWRAVHGAGRHGRARCSSRASAPLPRSGSSRSSSVRP